MAAFPPVLARLEEPDPELLPEELPRLEESEEPEARNACLQCGAPGQRFLRRCPRCARRYRRLSRGKPRNRFQRVMDDLDFPGHWSNR